MELATLEDRPWGASMTYTGLHDLSEQQVYVPVAMTKGEEEAEE